MPSDASQCGCPDINEQQPIAVAVVTLSDSRKLSDDRSGDRVVELVQKAGHTVVRRELLRDDAEPLGKLLDELSIDTAIDVIITTGGTGIAHRDLAIDVIRRCLDVELPGFGEHFRALSLAEIGPKAMLSRATAGRIGRVSIFALPGSTGAVQTAMTQCVLPVLRHVVALSQPKD